MTAISSPFLQTCTSILPVFLSAFSQDPELEALFSFAYLLLGGEIRFDSFSVLLDAF